MATTTIPWGDGSGDNIYLTYSASQGDQTVLVSSDANGGPARTKDITFVSTVGNISRVLTVLQESGMDYVSITWNDVCITYNDTAIAYPYVEPYIVFVDSEVEQICVSSWGDGTGLKPSQAAQVTSLGGKFNNNTDITSFDELRYFTGISTFRRSTNSFSNASNLENVTMPSSTLIVGENMFSTGLKRISFINSNVITFEGYSFYTPNAIEEVHITNLDNWLRSTFNLFGNPLTRAHHLYLNTEDDLYSTTNEVTSVTFPNDLTSISNNVLNGCTGITSVTMSNSVTTIGYNAFRDCTSLTSVTLSTSVTALESSVFYNCPITNIDLSHIKSIADSAARGMRVTSLDLSSLETVSGGYNLSHNQSLTNILIGPNVTALGNTTFYNDTSLSTVVIKATTPPTIGGTTFYSCPLNKIYVPYSSNHSVLAAYQSASNWSSFASKMQELNPDGTIPT